jgi:adenine-specific DNA-methyltransferase
MVNYSCDVCGKTFKQKGHFMKHLQRKTPCDNIKDKIEKIVEKKVDELVEEKIQKMIDNGEIEIKNNNLITSNQSNNIEMDKEYIHSKGQYFTKHESLQKCVIKFILNKPTIILEPSIGRGDLVKCVSETLDTDFDMCEIDENIKLLDNIDKNEVIYGDFLEIKISKKYDTIIGNPPFVRTHKGNLYLDFIKKCFDLLNDNGELIFIVPTDFFKLTSANKLLSEMISVGNFTHVYHPNNEGLFEGASIDVMVFRYCKDYSKEKLTLYNDEKKYLIESCGLITFSNEKIQMDDKLSDYFDISVGMVCGRESVYRNKELGNLKILSNKDNYTTYIYIDKFPCSDEKINQHLLNHKEDLINRKIKRYDEKNWFEWGAPRNVKKMEKYKGEKCIYILPLTRDKNIAFIGEVDYFGGLIMMRPTKECDLQKIIDHLNSESFKSNYMYSGRFKIGHRQLSNTYISL